MTTREDNADLRDFLEKVKTEQERRAFFAIALMNPAFHWFFTQGQQALEAELYIPGVSSILNGVEASLRVTMAQISPEYDGELSLSPYHVLSNTILSKAHIAGLPAIVQLRHDVCHGNILNFIQKMEFEQIEILTPECLRPTAALLLGVAYNWAIGLAKFRTNTGRRPEGYPIPKMPINPLEEWLQYANAGPSRLADGTKI